MKIKEMGEAERPREKMLSRGPGALSDTELLAILLRGGTPKESALGIARTLLGLTDGRLSALFNMGAEKMMQVPGVGECKAATLLAAMELGRRYLQEESTVVKKPVVTSRMVYDLMIPLMIEKGYHRDYSCALASTASTMGPIVPPSVLFIPFGVMAGISVSTMFAAGMLPGLLMGICMAVCNFFICKKKLSMTW